MFSCSDDEFREVNETNIDVEDDLKAQFKRGADVSAFAINYIKQKTNNTFSVNAQKGEITLSSASYTKNNQLGTVDTSKEIVVINETNSKHTFKVITPDAPSNTITNLIVVEKGEDSYEYFLRYTFVGEPPLNDDGTVDFSKFNGTIETFNAAGESIGSIAIENGTITNNQGQLAPCPDEPESTDTSTNTGGSDSSTSIPNGNDETPDTNGNGNGDPDTSAQFTDSDGNCGVTWSYKPCGCGGDANGHRPSGPDCCEGSPLVINSCNGSVTIYPERSQYFGNRLFKRNGIDPCNDGDVGVILSDEDDCDTSKEDLKKVFPNASDDNLKLLAKVINDKGKDFGIDSKEKLWHFLSQAGHEVGGEFANGIGTTENLNYTTLSRLKKIYKNYFQQNANDTAGKREADSTYLNNSSKVANYVYANRLGNGNEASGDGYKYRGRGIFQLTGKSNYESFKTFYNDEYDPDIDPVTTPSLLTTNDTIAVVSALWYYKNRVLDEITVDSLTSVKKVTRKVNGGKNGLRHRKKIFTKAKDSITCN